MMQTVNGRLARSANLRGVACVAALMACSGASASIVSATNGLTILPGAPGGLVGLGTLAAVWSETQNVSIVALNVTMRPIAGVASDPGTPNPGPLTAVVNSYMIHISPVAGTWTPGVTTVTFGEPIVGVSYILPDLGASDFLSPAGTTFDPYYLREFTTGGPFGNYINVNGNSITFLAIEPQPNWAQMRVLTAAPTPSSAGVVALGIGMLLRRRRRCGETAKG